MALTPDLYGTSAPRLNSFVAQYLQPSREWKEEVLEAVRTVEQFLREETFQGEHGLNQDVRVLKVVKVRLMAPHPQARAGGNPAGSSSSLMMLGTTRLVIPSLCCSHLRTPHLSSLYPTTLLP